MTLSPFLPRAPDQPAWWARPATAEELAAVERERRAAARLPVVVDILREDGTIQYHHRLRKPGESVEDYVHSGQTIRVREMTTEELHNDPLYQKIVADPEDEP